MAIKKCWFEEHLIFLSFDSFHAGLFGKEAFFEPRVIYSKKMPYFSNSRLVCSFAVVFGSQFCLI